MYFLAAAWLVMSLPAPPSCTPLQEWREDVSNCAPEYTRNKVRLQLMPLLEEITGGALHARLAAAEAQSSQLRSWLDAETEAHLASDPTHGGARGAAALGIARWEGAPSPVQDALLHALVAGCVGVGRDQGGGGKWGGLSISFEAVGRVRTQLERGGLEWKLELGGGVTLSRAGDVLSVRVADGVDPPPTILELAHGVTLRHPVRWRVRAGYGSQICDTFEAPPIMEEVPMRHPPLVVSNVPRGASLCLRSWRTGDR